MSAKAAISKAMACDPASAIIVIIVIIIIDHLGIALFSALEQTHCAYVACVSGL